MLRIIFRKTDAGRCGGCIQFSPNYLSQLFGKYGDSGFVEYITETRIAAAKEMLEQGDLKVYEIAEKLGYESAFYFPRYSKGHGAQPAGIPAKYLNRRLL